MESAGCSLASLNRNAAGRADAILAGRDAKPQAPSMSTLRLGEPPLRLRRRSASIRCAPQIHGAAEAACDFAASIFEAELRAACDNPPVDPATGAVFPHGNVETTACCLAMDTLRQALAKVIETAGQRIHQIRWPELSGLPTGLAAAPGAAGGVPFLKLGHLAGAAVGAVRQAAAPPNYSGQLDDGVEDVGGNAPQSVAETVRALPPAWNVLAIEVACAVWAIQRRGLPVDALGQGLRPLARQILALLPIGREGERVFDLAPLADAVRAAAAAT